MHCLGIDLAAQPKATAVCMTKWQGNRFEIEELDCGVEDPAIVDLMLSADKVGLDAPLGWPDDFVAAVDRHHRQATDSELPERRMLTLRQTDRELQDATGRRPLSVSTDLIGVVALRGIGLQDELASRGEPVDRTGRGRVCEVYPAAALESWGIDARGYKAAGGSKRLPEILAQLIAGLGDSELTPEHVSRLEVDHNQLDAFICALVARAAALGRSGGPADEAVPRAGREGWIHVPNTDLEGLLAGT